MLPVFVGLDPETIQTAKFLFGSLGFFMSAIILLVYTGQLDDAPVTEVDEHGY